MGILSRPTDAQQQQWEGARYEYRTVPLQKASGTYDKVLNDLGSQGWRVVAAGEGTLVLERQADS